MNEHPNYSEYLKEQLEFAKEHIRKLEMHLGKQIATTQTYRNSRLARALREYIEENNKLKARIHELEFEISQRTEKTGHRKKRPKFSSVYLTAGSRKASDVSA